LEYPDQYRRSTHLYYSTQSDDHKDDYSQLFCKSRDNRSNEI
jgi:hypothetical protein